MGTATSNQMIPHQLPAPFHLFIASSLTHVLIASIDARYAPTNSPSPLAAFSQTRSNDLHLNAQR